jgi:hypothetical protein
LIIDGSFLYASNYDIPEQSVGTISKINLETGAIVDPSWATGLNAPINMAIYDSYMFVSNAGIGTEGGSVSRIDLATGEITDLAWIYGLLIPFGLVIDNPYIYVSDLYAGIIGQYSLIRAEPPLPESNICFPATTPILTDQGIIDIDKIDPDLHTIRGTPIIDITKTITKDTYLVCFEKDALGPNQPSEKTVMSRKHRLLYNGKCIEAYKFLGRSDSVHKVKYDGEILYNVLLNEHSAISVNNLICETLHPNNIIAKFFTRKNKYTEEERRNMILALQRRNTMKKIEFFK